MFGNALGYAGPVDGRDVWHRQQHHPIDGETPDAILGFFRQSEEQGPGGSGHAHPYTGMSPLASDTTLIVWPCYEPAGYAVSLTAEALAHHVMIVRQHRQRQNNPAARRDRATAASPDGIAHS